MTRTDWHPEHIRRRLEAYPPYQGAGVRVPYVAADASEIRVEMALTEANANLVGTHFGGSLYAMVDPHLMILLKARLGPRYVVWDREAHIDFRKPGEGIVWSSIRITDQELADIRAATSDGGRHLPEWTLEIRDEDDDVVAAVRKVLHVRLRRDA